MNRTRALSAALALALAAGAAAVAIAQPERAPTGAERRLQAQVDRMMNFDTDGNGTVSRDEMPSRLADRIFDAADENGDGELTREEIAAHLGNRDGGQGGGRERPGDGGAPDGGGEGGGSSHEMFEGSMKAAGGAMRTLSRTRFEPETRGSDLDAVQSLQEAMILGKGLAAQEKMASPAAEKYGDDVDAFRRDIRQGFVDVLWATLDLEAAILAGDSERAKEAFGAVRAAQNMSHDAFQED